MTIDYRSLLKRYMALVLHSEGTTFVGNAEYQGDFNDLEVSELEQLYVEVTTDAAQTAAELSETRATKWLELLHREAGRIQHVEQPRGNYGRKEESREENAPHRVGPEPSEEVGRAAAPQHD